ncbi:hypothetical protein CEXT_51671 [Caerostris extrusa]|uniref:Uncharacterized protein n=1 Tax=Caerostris extrusa TaxID=172846 RepID=A0AAV4Y4A7_CAEEX|nr:hypothetical protein CEXT_51671 [Caerostris extrusa]
MVAKDVKSSEVSGCAFLKQTYHGLKNPKLQSVVAKAVKSSEVSGYGPRRSVKLSNKSPTVPGSLRPLTRISRPFSFPPFSGAVPGHCLD